MAFLRDGGSGSCRRSVKLRCRHAFDLVLCSVVERVGDCGSHWICAESGPRSGLACGGSYLGPDCAGWLGSVQFRWSSSIPLFVPAALLAIRRTYMLHQIGWNQQRRSQYEPVRLVEGVKVSAEAGDLDDAADDFADDADDGVGGVVSGCGGGCESEDAEGSEEDYSGMAHVGFLF